MTLEEFATIINEADTWLLEFNNIIKANRWSDDTYIDNGICHSDNETLLFFNASAKVVPNEYFFEFKNKSGSASSDDTTKTFDTQEEAKNWAKQYIANALDGTTQITISLFGKTIYDYSE